MRISVISHQGQPLPAPAGFDFDTRGGGIGRGAGNEILLNDPERHVSRLQARIEHDGSRFLLVDQGSNPTRVDGRPLGKGASVELHGGERITMGPYELEVEALMPEPAQGADQAASAADPLGLLGAGFDAGSESDDPFERFARQSVSAAASVPPPDEDPFAVFAMSPAAPPSSFTQAAQAADPLGVGVELGEPSVDELFGLAAASVDPFQGTALADPGGRAPAAAAPSVDPLALFGATTPPPSVAPERDDAALLRQAFTPPQPLSPSPPPAAPAAMVLSWETAAAPEPALARTPDAVTPVTCLMPAAPALVTAQAAPSVPVASSVAPVTAAGSGDLLLDAFLRGLGVALDLPAGLTPELMQRIGVMLREATQGTLDLMQARALTKREVRAELTMIVRRDNNPLKFSPDLGFALVQLLTAKSSGFMDAEAAMRDAYDDLRAHQFGVMAGMRAALEGVLQRFTPAEIEQRVAARGLLDNLLPGIRKARMWELFEARYAEISREAADDFQALFGRAFLKAYDEQVERLRQTDAPQRRPRS